MTSSLNVEDVSSGKAEGQVRDKAPPYEDQLWAESQGHCFLTGGGLLSEVVIGILFAFSVSLGDK